MFKLAFFMHMNQPTPSTQRLGVSFLGICFTPALFYSQIPLLH